MIDKSKETNEEQTLSKLNRWLTVIIVFMIIYAVGVLVLIDQKTEDSIKKHPMIMLDMSSSNIDANAFSNFFSTAAANLNKSLPSDSDKTPTPKKPMFEQKESYELGDFVVINFYYTEGIVIENPMKNHYRVMYKDHNHVLQSIVLNKMFLLSPTSAYPVSPTSFLIE